MGVPSNGDDSIVPPLIPIPFNMIKENERFQTYVDPIKEEDLIDCINKTYVAFTRPGKALHIFANEGSGKGTPLNQLLREYFEKNKGKGTPMLDDQGKVIGYTIGEELPYCPKKEDASKEAEPDALQMPAYAVYPIDNRLRIKMDQLVTENQDIGNRMHRIVSKIQYAGDVDKAIRYAIKRRILGSTDEQYWNIERADAFLRRLVTDATTAPWFAAENSVYNERPIFIPATANKPATTLRPDRIVRTPDGSVVVIDYKFGDAPSEAQKAAYEKQVANYCHLLSRLWNTHVEGYILYAKSFAIHQVEN